MKRLLRSGLATGLMLSLCSCAATTKLGGAPGLVVADASEMPAPSTSDLIAREHPYMVGPFDRLTIGVFGIPGLQALDVQVDAAGRISVPLAGIVPVSGKTPSDIELDLRERFKAAFIRDPQVTVNLKETLSQMVTVEGQVQKPGLYPVMGRTTLLRTIATAQGSTEFAKVDDVVVLRQVGGKQYAALYNLNSIRHGRYKDPDIYANDIVMVGDNHARRIFKDYLTTMGILAGPIIIALQNF